VPPYAVAAAVVVALDPYGRMYCAWGATCWRMDSAKEARSERKATQKGKKTTFVPQTRHICKQIKSKLTLPLTSASPALPAQEPTGHHKEDKHQRGAYRQASNLGGGGGGERGR